jgi:hypothetical protein
MIKPLLVKKPTTCACGGPEAWCVTMPDGTEIALACTYCSTKPSIETVVAKIREMAGVGDLNRLELLVRTSEKDVITQQSLVDEDLMDRIEDYIRHGFQFKNGEVKLLVEEIKRLRLELSDFEMLCDHTSQIYDWASGGRISKPTTLPSEVIMQGENRINDLINESVLESTEGLSTLLKALREHICNPFAWLMNGSMSTVLSQLIDDAVSKLPVEEPKQKRSL